MATVTSLTEQKIQELVAGWEGVSLDQDELKAIIAQLLVSQDSTTAALDELNNITMPQLRADLDAGSILVSNLNDNLIPDLDLRMDQNDLDLQNLNTVDIPSLQGQITSNSDWILEFDGVTVPALNARLDAHDTTLNDLNTVTLPAITQQVNNNTTSLNDLNTVTLPDLNQRLTAVEGSTGFDPTAMQAEIDALEAKFPIEADDVAANTLTANQIAAHTITALQIAADTITANEIAADAITANEIASRTITALEIAAGAITANEIAANTITANEIAADAITADEIASRTITALEIAADTITTNEIAADAITANEIASRTITALEIAADTITANEIAADTITANEIASRTITALEIVADTITANEIATDTITANEIATDTITANEIAAATITGSEIAADAITAAHIAAGAVTALEIAANTITAANIKTGEISGDLLSADVILSSSRIAAIGTDGQSVEMNPDGFYVYGPTSEGRPAYVSFPTEGGSTGKPNIISGTLQATTLSVDGNADTGQAATFRANSQLEPGATLTLNNSVVAPVSMPSALSIADPNASSGTGPTIVGSFAGMTYHPGQNAIYFLTSSGFAPNITVRVYKHDLTTNVRTLERTIKFGTRGDVTPMGITYVNNHFHVGYYDGGNIQIARYDATWAQNASANYGAVGGKPSFTLGNDGTNLWIADFGSTATVNGIRLRRYLNTMSTVVQETLNTTATVPEYEAMFPTTLNSVDVGNFDLGARKIMVAYSGGQFATDGMSRDVHGMVAFNTSGVKETTSGFFLMGGNYPQALAWKGSSNNDTAGRFIGVIYANPTPIVYTYSKLKLADTRIWWSAGSSFYRSSDGAETTLSPIASFYMYSRWYWKVTVTSPPSGLSSRIYLSQIGGIPTASRLQATLTGSVTSVTSETFDAAGALAKAASTFGSAVPSLIQSQETIIQIVNMATTINSTVVTGSGLRTYMEGRPISGTGIQAGTTIVSVNPGVSAVLSKPATATWSNINANLTLPKLEIRGNGYARITELERVVINSTQDANVNAGNEPALRIGNIDGQHLRLDGNELISMSSPSTQGLLYLNIDGETVAGSGTGSFRIGSAGARIAELEAGSETKTTNTSGQFTVNHGLSVTPHLVIATKRAAGADGYVMVGSHNSTTFTCTFRNNTGGLITSASQTVDWIAIRLA